MRGKGVKPMKKFFSFVVGKPVLALLISLCITLPFLYFLPQVKTVDNVDYFTPDDDPDMVFYHKFKEIFGNDEFFLIAFKAENIFTKENLGLVQDISNRLEDLEQVRDIISLTSVDDIYGEEDFFSVEKFIQTIPESPEEFKVLKANALSNSLYLKNLISQDGKTVAITVFPKEDADDKGFRKKLVDSTMDILAPYQKQGKRFYLGGMTITNLRLSQFMKSDLALFIPISYLVIVLAMVLIFRSMKIVLLAFINISLCLGATIGFMGMIGTTMNNVTSIVPSLIMAICLADSIHIFSRFLSFYSQASGDKLQALHQTLMAEYKPCLLTSITTILGFMSLRMSSLPPIRDFGLIASAGIFLAYILSFVFLPSLICLAGSLKREGSDLGLFNTLLQWFSKVCTRYATGITAVTTGMVILCLAAIPTIKIETNLLEFFKKDTELRQSIDFIETNLSGVETIQISLKKDAEDAFLDPVNLKVIEMVHGFLAGMPGIDTVNSYTDFIKDMNMAFHNEDRSFYTVPESRQLVAQYMLLYGSEDIDDYINPSYDHARIVARTSVHGSRELGDMLLKIDRFLEEKVPPEIRFRITGETRKVVNIVDYLVEGQVNSILMAMVTISIIMFFIMKSFQLGLISLVPNFFPIVMNFGIMAFLGIPLNTSTSLIAAIAIGIAVDDTIHFMYQYKKQLSRTSGISKAVQNAIMYKGSAIITTSLILFAGFGVLMFSSFVPTIQFGFLTAVIMISALAGDLIITPALLIFLERKNMING